MGSLPGSARRARSWTTPARSLSASSRGRTLGSACEREFEEAGRAGGRSIYLGVVRDLKKKRSRVKTVGVGTKRSVGRVGLSCVRRYVYVLASTLPQYIYIPRVAATLASATLPASRLGRVRCARRMDAVLGTTKCTTVCGCDVKLYRKRHFQYRLARSIRFTSVRIGCGHYRPDVSVPILILCKE